ncbi:MAG: ABC transporter substrate-binding protein/permease [Eubacteriales bacterium]|nr:ABC transporter substrate-binding protein/permease [Eubacteriales bacterium]
MHKKRWWLFILIFALFFMGSLKTMEVWAGESVDTLSAEDLAGRTAGVMVGTPQDDIIGKSINDVQFLFYNAYTDMILALEEKKIDFFTASTVAFGLIKDSHPDLIALENISLKDIDTGAVFAMNSTGESLKKEYDQYLSEIEENGKLNEIGDYWKTSYEKEPVEIPTEGSKGRIRIAANSTAEPYAYILNGEPAGMDIDVAADFCRSRGYAMEITMVDPSGSIPGVVAGKFDMAVGQITYTEERAETVLYSELYDHQQMVPIANRKNLKVFGIENEDDSQKEETNFIDKIVESFQKTFIREERWKLIVKGLINTILLTVLSAFFGTLLGFGIFSLKRKGGKSLLIFVDWYIKILQGLPMVLLLMILYYVVFGNSNFPAFWVALLGFALNFSAYVAVVIESGVESIDRGQNEAALALGYTQRQAFHLFILPQAILRTLPVYRGQLVSLLKGTAVVGYIAIEDLTKISDIIRSRTYEAFFPLIVTAILYFFLSWLIGIAIEHTGDFMDPRKKKMKKED